MLLPSIRRGIRRYSSVDTDDFLNKFCALEADRKNLIQEQIRALGLTARELRQGNRCHLFIDPPLRGRSGARPVVLIAHYDRVPGTPGANDNGASVVHLLLLLKRVMALGESALWPELRVIFTDGEELAPGQGPMEQGSFELGKFLKKTRLATAFYIVLDMTGIGDTVVLGQSALPHIKKSGLEIDSGILTLFAANRLVAKKVLSCLHEGFFIETDTPFSDDLGLLMAGITSCQISLLPKKEAIAFRKNGVEGLPKAWATMHTPLDKPENLWEKSRSVVRDLLDHFLAYPIPHV